MRVINKQKLVLLINLVVFISFIGITAYAAATHVKFEAESGSTSSGANIFSDQNASGGSAVAFQGTTTPPPPPSGGYYDGSVRPFNSTSPWNTPTPTNTQWYDHPMLHNLTEPYNGDIRRHWWMTGGSVVIWYGKETDPIWTLDLPEYIYTPANRNRPAMKVQVRAPANMKNGGDIDQVLVIISGTTYYEIWRSTVDPVNMVVRGDPNLPGWAMGDVVNGPGAGSSGNNDGIRAANYSVIGGLITGQDLQKGKIDHALAVALTNQTLKSTCGTAVPINYRWPATSNDWTCQAYGPLQMGTKIGIPAGTPRPAGLSWIGNMVFDAIVTYGIYVGDWAGGEWPLLYTEQNTIPEPGDAMCELFCFWNYGGSADMEKISPLLRVADYQP